MSYGWHSQFHTLDTPKPYDTTVDLPSLAEETGSFRAGLCLAHSLDPPVWPKMSINTCWAGWVGRGEGWAGLRERWLD